MALPWELNDATRSAITRVRVVKVDDKKSQQFVDLKGRKNEEPGEVLSIQPHGFGSNPPKDTEGVIIPMGGRSDRSLLLTGSHEKYRPTETPEGDSYIYNHSGDIIRVFKKNLDVVHSQKINLQIGKGQDVSGKTSKPGDNSGQKAISVVLTGDSMVLTYDDVSVTLASGVITHKATKVVVDSPNIFLGGETGALRVKRIDDSASTTTKAI